MCVCLRVCVCLCDDRDSGALILMCVGVSQFMQQHPRVLGSTDSLGLEIIHKDEMFTNTEMYRIFTPEVTQCFVYVDGL